MTRRGKPSIPSGKGRVCDWSPNLPDRENANREAADGLHLQVKQAASVSGPMSKLCWVVGNHVQMNGDQTDPSLSWTSAKHLNGTTTARIRLKHQSSL